MKNKHPDFCLRCYKPVAAGAGTVIKNGSGWETVHDECVESALARQEELKIYEANLRRDVLADSRCRDWLSAKGRYV